MLTVMWLMTHRYQGLAQDARIYAMQALAKMNPALQSDLYLQNTSQDRYTFFSPFYAEVIHLIGLKEAASSLTVLFTLWFLAAAWTLTRVLAGRDEAWLAVGLLVLTVGAYGSHGVFHFSEDYLTARLPAEALIATALALHYLDYRRSALSIAIGTLLVHPLMALPGVVLLIFLAVPTRARAVMAVAAVASALALAVAVSTVPALQPLFPVLDAAWLQVVQERAQFLFLQLWSWPDWETNIRPFASLALSALVFTDPRIRKLCIAAALVGASGLGVACIAGTVGPVALLLQGQAWRWMWITAFVGVILVLPTALRLWRNENCGPICAILLVASWTLSQSFAPLLTLAALAVFLGRASMVDVSAKYGRWAALALGLAILCWMVSDVTTLVSARTAGDTPFLQRPGALSAIRLPLVAALILVWHCLTTSRSVWIPMAACAALAVPCVLLMPVAFNKIDRAGSVEEIAEFAEWRRVIPPSATVYLADGRDAASFAWFTLQRQSYLSLDQSAGVIFSRATALEVQRRAAVLLPLMSEDWKLLSKNRASVSTSVEVTWRRTPLTAAGLVSVCSDPHLGFLIAHESVGFDSLRHSEAGAWKDWNLYDCDRVRGAPAV